MSSHSNRLREALRRGAEAYADLEDDTVEHVRNLLVAPQGSWQLNYAYDSLNRLTAITPRGASQPTASFTYDALSRRTRLALENGTETLSTYDAIDRLLMLEHRKMSQGSLGWTLRLSSTYDALGNRLSEKRVEGSVTARTFRYDARSQLLSAFTSGAGTTAYTYDPLGNRTQVVAPSGSTAYASNLLNQYASVGPTPLTYDPNGNLTSDGTRTDTYDSENRLRQATGAFGTATYTYDPFGRRLSMTVNGTTTRVLYDGDQAIAETDAAGTLQTTTIAGPGLDAPVRLGQGAKARYVCADALGSPVLLTDAAGTVLERYRYDAFGAPTITSATGQALSRSAYGNRILFTGREYEAETGLYYYRARYYSPTLGRFLSRDPLGPLPDLNLYRYVGNNPATWLDPWGLDKQRHDAPEPNTPPAPPFDPPPFFPLLMPIPLMTSSGPMLAPGLVPVPGLPLPRPGIEKNESDSGKPRRHFPRYPTRNRAKDAARRAGKGPPIEHGNPKTGPPHFHPVDESGEKIPGVHYGYPD